jgi:Acyltransferase family
VNAEAATTPTRLPGLDLLRAVAISWVMAYHASSFGLISRDHWIAKFGWMGVDLFFVLSGFLIAGQLLRPWARGHQPNYSRFFARRLLRTLPAYLAVVALCFLFPVLRERLGGVFSRMVAVRRGAILPSIPGDCRDSRRPTGSQESLSRPGQRNGLLNRLIKASIGCGLTAPPSPGSIRCRQPNLSFRRRADRRRHQLPRRR